MSAGTPAERRAVAESNYSRWVGEGGSSASAKAAGGSAGRRSRARARRATPSPLATGSVVIAAITSCTNTSNPSVMVGAGLLARKAVEKGLASQPLGQNQHGARLARGDRVSRRGRSHAVLRRSWASTSWATGAPPASATAGRFPSRSRRRSSEHELVAAAVLSGNRNFEARVHPQVRANYLASPMLVVAFALAGRVDIDLATEPLGKGKDGEAGLSARHLADSGGDSRDHGRVAEAGAVHGAIRLACSTATRSGAPSRCPAGDRFAWDPQSTYVQEPPFFQGLPATRARSPTSSARGCWFRWAIRSPPTTSRPAGAIPKNGPAARYLLEHGVPQDEWNTFGARRGNHEVMMRGTFGNVRIKNQLVPEKEGELDHAYPPPARSSRIYDAAMRYSGKACRSWFWPGRNTAPARAGTGPPRAPRCSASERCWPRAYERIHRSNLVGMGVLPLGYERGAVAREPGADRKRGVRHHRHRRRPDPGRPGDGTGAG